MKKIKIAHMVVALDGGVGNVIINYFDHLPLEDYEVHILSHDVSSDLYRKRYEERGFKVIELPKKRNGLAKSMRATWNVCRQNQYDIVHCHQTLTSLFPLLSAKLAGIPVLISHSHLVVPRGGSKRDDILIFLNHHFSRWVATDCMACGTDAGISNFGNKQQFHVLNNALELERYRFSPEVRNEVRKELGVEDCIVIGHVGRFTKQKNHLFLLDVFQLVCEREKRARLLLLGEGNLMPKVQAYAEEKGILDKVIFAGAVDDVPRKLQAMDVFVLPSFSEGLPVVALEAQASGLPCVISDQVTREVGVIPQVAYLSISQKTDIKTWADQCLQFCNGIDRTADTGLILREHGYDITVEAKKLDQYYKERVGG